MSEKRPREAVGHSDDEGRDGSEGRRVRAIRSLGMSDDEWAARERRRISFLSREGKRGDGQQRYTEESSSSTLETVRAPAEVVTEAGILGSSQQPPAETVESQERKPWESLVIGDLGENLSRIEQKNREIEQQRFIVQFHEKNSPHEVEHNKTILSQLIQERAGMEDSEENNLPRDQREKGERVSKRLELLQSVLDNSRCEDERINVRAAIEGYRSGQIPYSCDFTLLYAGHIVDRCQTYESFCVDRNERLDRYFANHGPGWLWQEPPLAGPSTGVLGMKGLCIERNTTGDPFGIGAYYVNMEFTAQRDKVSRGTSQTYPHQKGGELKNEAQNREASCQLSTLLDSGATFPIIFKSDLLRLNVDISNYPAQGILTVNTLTRATNMKFYEMYVSICSPDGGSLVSQGDNAIWPTEPRTLGGFCPVLALKGRGGGHRVSGMLPFDACYVSSAPSMERIWLGEGRRDVLGTSRMPAHLRYDSDKEFKFQYPEEFETLRLAARTPDRVMFIHNSPDDPDIILIDGDTASAPGRNELGIIRYENADGNHEQRPRRKVLSQRVIRVESRKGDIEPVPKVNPRPWRDWFKKDGQEE
ncbi:hypothetical protein ANO14919_107450 [Xylariales sp. No.14919]|nr:hypothetical protein ANO14919_107450 [Xylariales sp. No.14919]